MERPTYPDTAGKNRRGDVWNYLVTIEANLSWLEFMGARSYSYLEKLRDPVQVWLLTSART